MLAIQSDAVAAAAAFGAPEAIAKFGHRKGSRERSGELMSAMRASSADWSIVGGLRRGQRRDNWLGKHWRGWRGLLRLGPA